MKPISPFDSAPVSAMNFPVSEYVSAFRDAGKMQMAGQQSMMEGINKGISSVTDYLEESRKSQAQANAFKPFFNKATLQNLMGISWDESAAVIEQFKNASTDEKIALGKVLTGTFVEAENQKKQLLSNQDIALATLAGKLGRPLYSSGGVSGVGGAQPAEPALPAPGDSSLNEPSLFPPMPNKDGGVSRTTFPVLGAVNKWLEASNEEEKQRQIKFQNSLNTVNQKLIEVNKKPMEDLQSAKSIGDKYLEHKANRQMALNKIAALEEERKKYIAFGDKDTGTALHDEAEGIRKNQPDVLEDFAKTQYVKDVFEQSYTKNIKDFGNNLSKMQSMINTTRGMLDRGDTTKALGNIKTFLIQAGNSLSAENAVGDQEAIRIAEELSPLFGKGAIGRLYERVKTGDFKLEQITGTNIKDYLDRMEEQSMDLTTQYNNYLIQRVTKPLGSYATEKGITPITWNAKKIEQPDSIPGVNQGGGTQVNTPIKLRATTSGITPSGNTGVAPENKPKAPVYYEPSYNF